MALHYVLGMLIAGFALGTTFDFYNTVTGATNWLRWTRPILDIAFWVTGALIVFRLSLATDDGRLRLYTFGLLLVGYLLYAAMAKRIVVGSALAIVHAVRRILRFIWYGFNILVIQPIWFVIKICMTCLKLLYQLGMRVENVLTWIAVRLLKLTLFPISPTLRWLQPWGEKISVYQEGIWTRLSNWLRKSPNGA